MSDYTRKVKKILSTMGLNSKGVGKVTMISGTIPILKKVFR